MQRADLIVVGGGIVGLAAAWQFTLRYPGKTVIVLEKEQRVADHQTGHNSGVLHTGIYYRPETLRAKNCRTGKLAMEQFCREQEIPFDLCGKVIVAVEESELPQLEIILQRGQANGVNCQIISQERLREIEPHAAGIRAIHVPEAGIVDYRQVSERLAERIRQSGGQVVCKALVTAVNSEPEGVVVTSKAGEFRGRFLVTCGGLWADKVIGLTGTKPQYPIVPFRGEYFDLKPEAHHLVKGLIYPVPNPSFPFLGVHFTRTIHGGVECGPNAVFAFARDGYRKTDFRFGDVFEALGYSGFRNLVMKNWRTGLGEMWRSWNKGAFVKALQRLVPEIRSEHLVAAPAGVRAQAIGPDGKLVDDFVFQETDRIINVGNAPSPAATASLNIGRIIIDRLSTRDV